MPKALHIGTVLGRSDLFGGLGRDSLDRLAAIVRPVAFTKGKTLFNRGDPVNGCYAILDGALKVSIVEDGGSETLIAVLGPGDVAGEMGMVDRQPRSATVSALKASTLGHLPLKDFELLANRDTEIYRHLLRVLSGRLRTANQTLVDRQQPTAGGRLARALLRLSEGFGEPVPQDRVLIRQKITQSQLGTMAGCARENVSRQISEWRRDGLLTRISGYYCIEDIKALRDIAGL